MNSIKAKVDKSNYEIYGDFLNIEIDGYWLDEKLDEFYPNNMYKGLIPTLLFAMEIEQEKEVVWKRILPKNNSKETCPILMCPDDCDFSCTIIVAEIESNNRMVKWNKVGIDKTKELDANKVGSKVEWFDKMKPLQFDKTEYEAMIEKFKNQIQIDEEKWQIRNQEFLKRN
ncbi:MAG: hypothetical protein R2828_34185 [Saprospiraceae bacterium]